MCKSWPRWEWFPQEFRLGVKNKVKNGFFVGENLTQVIFEKNMSPVGGNAVGLYPQSPSDEDRPRQMEGLGGNDNRGNPENIPGPVHGAVSVKARMVQENIAIRYVPLKEIVADRIDFVMGDGAVVPGDQNFGDLFGLV